jgi:hypothetical protein
MILDTPSNNKKLYRGRHLVPLGDDESSKSAREFVLRGIQSIPGKFANPQETVEEIEGIVANMVAADTTEGLELARRFGEDLYTAYYHSSGLLTDTMGPELLLRAFRALAPIWWAIASSDEFDAHGELNDELVLYRGGIGPGSELAKGISWTTDKQAARLFMDAPGSILIRAKARKVDVLAYYNECSECIIDPAKLASIGVVETLDS